VIDEIIVVNFCNQSNLKLGELVFSLSQLTQELNQVGSIPIFLLGILFQPLAPSLIAIQGELIEILTRLDAVLQLPVNSCVLRYLSKLHYIETGLTLHPGVILSHILHLAVWAVVVDSKNLTSRRKYQLNKLMQPKIFGVNMLFIFS
jgi:hypothetical protein